MCKGVKQVDTQKKIEVMQAAVAGKRIQFKRHGENGWLESSGLVWDWQHKVYRIKPVPREVFINIYKGTAVAYKTKEEANQKIYNPVEKAVTFIEVLEDN